MICAKSWDCNTALAVAKAESGMRCDAIGDGHIAFTKNEIEYGKSYGVFQIRYLVGRPDPSKLLDCAFNINHAHGMYLAQGWRPWSAFTNGSYKKFLQ